MCHVSSPKEFHWQALGNFSVWSLLTFVPLLTSHTIVGMLSHVFVVTLWMLWMPTMHDLCKEEQLSWFPVSHAWYSMHLDIMMQSQLQQNPTAPAWRALLSQIGTRRAFPVLNCVSTIVSPYVHYWCYCFQDGAVVHICIIQWCILDILVW